MYNNDTNSAVDAVINQDSEILYDAEASQSVKLQDDEDFAVTCEFNPTDDERFLQFAEDCKTQLFDDASFVQIENTKALINLWNDQCSDLKGLEGERPDNWKEIVDDVDIKIPSMTHYLTVSAYKSPSKVWQSNEAVIISESYFNNLIATGRHFLRKRTVDDVKAYRRTQKMPIGKQKGLRSSSVSLPNHTKERALIYDQMCIRQAEGYKSHIPIWHKIAVIDAEFASGLDAKK